MERRCVRKSRRHHRQPGRLVVRATGGEQARRRRRTSAERIQHIAEQARFVAAVLDRMLERGLPAGEQDYEEKNPRETGAHLLWSGYLLGVASTRR